MITILGLGPGSAALVTQSAYDTIKKAQAVYVRTRMHPAVEELESLGFQFLSFDSLYESAGSFDEVYERIAEQVLSAAEKHGDALYAVPGHPLMGERTVEMILQRAPARGQQVRLVSGVSFVEPILEAVGQGLSIGLKILDALSVDVIGPDPHVPNIIYQVHDRFVASQVKLALLEVYPPDFRVLVVRAAGLPDKQTVTTVELSEMDHTDDFDHLTSLWVPAAE